MSFHWPEELQEEPPEPPRIGRSILTLVLILIAAALIAAV